LQPAQNKGGAMKARRKPTTRKSPNATSAQKEGIMLKAGDKAPTFRLKADDGKEISLADLRGKKVVLYFYPRAMTSGCTLETQNFRDLKPQFDKAGAVILGCSGDTVEAQAKFHAKEKVNFSLLSDPQFDAIEAYDARRMKSFLGKTFLGIVRSTFLIGADGRIAKIWDKVKVKGHAEEVLDAVKTV
jgi:thioredoxin-dependent peroxiredoxin